MRPMETTLSKARFVARTALAAALVLLAWGCTTGRSSAPEFNPSTGQHPAAWTQNHWAEYVKHPDQCRSCHGSTTDPAQAGGTSGVSCFKCHTSPDHPAGWANPAQHGRYGAQLAANAANPTAMAGFAHCAKCHGDDYAGGISGVSCKGCHSKAPHPDRPWLGATAALPNHDKTDASNAAECAKCHLNGANSTRVPSSPAPANTQPGCYNNTLCHDQNP